MYFWFFEDKQNVIKLHINYYVNNGVQMLLYTILVKDL